MTPEKLIEKIAGYGNARASSAYAAMRGEDRESVREAGKAMDAINEIRAEIDRLISARDEARARVHMGHSGPYAVCLRRPCIGWHAHDKAAEASKTDVEVLHRECLAKLRADVARVTGERDDALKTIRALVGDSSEPLVALTMAPKAGLALWSALIFAANRVPADVCRANDETSHAEWLGWAASRLDAALLESDVDVAATASSPSGTEAGSRG